MGKFKVGDKVRLTKEGDKRFPGLGRALDVGKDVTVRAVRRDNGAIQLGWGSTYIGGLDNTYYSASRFEMADKFGGQFVIFQAVGFAEAPAQVRPATTIVNL